MTPDGEGTDRRREVTSEGAVGGSPTNERWARWRDRLTSFEVAAVAGVVCAVCWSISLRGLLGRPGLGASEDELRRHYADVGADATAVQLALMILGTVAYLWFVGVVRSRLGARESRLGGTVFLGASVLFTGLLLVGGAALAAPSILVELGGQQPDPGAASMVRALAAIILSVFAPRVATLVMFSVATLSRRAGALPRWLIVLTYVLGVVEFVNVTISTPILYVFPAWIALVSVVVLVRHPTPAPTAADGSSAPPG